MKKRNVNNKLKLSKKTISNFDSIEVKGGANGTFVDCGPLNTLQSVCAIGAERTNCISIGANTIPLCRV